MSEHAARELPQIQQKEIELKEKVKPINEQELAEILNSESFFANIVSSLSAVLNAPEGTEAGFKVLRHIDTGEHITSEVAVQGKNSVDLNNLSFPNASQITNRLIDTTPNGQVDVNNHDNWPTLDVASFHWHPILDRLPNWFRASSFDLKELAAQGTMNALKMRVESGLKPSSLRSLQEPEGDDQLTTYEKQLHPNYGLFIKGFFAPLKLKAVDPESIEAVYRPYEMIGMPLSATKAQILVLRDNPTQKDSMPSLPEVLRAEGHDIEGSPEECQSIIEYYQQMGFDAAIVFVDIGEEDLSYRMYRG